VGIFQGVGLQGGTERIEQAVGQQPVAGLVGVDDVAEEPLVIRPAPLRSTPVISMYVRWFCRQASRSASRWALMPTASGGLNSVFFIDRADEDGLAPRPSARRAMESFVMDKVRNRYSLDLGSRSPSRSMVVPGQFQMQEELGCAS